MRDGRTRELGARPGGPGSLEDYQKRYRATLVMVRGPGTGSEFSLDRPRVVIGRGEGARLRFADEAMSREHAAFEFAGDGFRLRDLESRNGTWLNGARIERAELKHGDVIQVGEHSFQLVIEARRRAPQTWEVPLDADDSEA
jgi:pSer/pThr/pTyr-binding forkhead associated (FHA) protein